MDNIKTSTSNVKLLKSRTNNIITHLNEKYLVSPDRFLIDIIDDEEASKEQVDFELVEE